MSGLMNGFVDVYEKYKHLDKVLNDREFLGNDLRMIILADLWRAIRIIVGAPADRPGAPLQGDTAAADSEGRL